MIQPTRTPLLPSVALALLLACSPTAADTVANVMGNSYGSDELAAQLERHQQVRGLDGIAEPRPEDLLHGRVTALTNFAVDTLVEARLEAIAPSDAQREARAQALRDSGIVPEWTDEMGRRNHLLGELADRVVALENPGDEELLAVYQALPEADRAVLDLPSEAWLMVAKATRLSGGCAGCEITTREQYLAFQREEAGVYLVRDAIANEMVAAYGLTQSEKLRSEVRALLAENNPLGLDEDEALARLLWEREYELWLVRSVREHLVVEGDPELARAVAEALDRREEAALPLAAHAHVLAMPRMGAAGVR
jgi:hypothetical protein